MYSSQTISLIKDLRRKGSTLTEIVEKTHLSKSRIFDYIKDIKQSKFLVKKIKINKTKARQILAENRRGKSLKTYEYFKPKKWNPEFVNLVAHFIFDGSIFRRSFTYYSRSDSLIELIIYEIKNVLGISDYKIYYSTGGVKKLAFHHVEITAYIKRKAAGLLEHILSAPKNQKISFLKSFFDDEGYVTFSKKKRMVRGYQHSVKILQIVNILLKDIGIKSKIDNKYFEIVISRKENIIKFQKLINFTSGLRVNGKRTNSIWKKDLEKREILQMAIDSYL